MKENLLDRQVFAQFTGEERDLSLPDLCRKLLEQQRSTWRQLQDNYVSLKQSAYRDLARDGFHYRLQFNPGRIISAAAKVDALSIAQRKCFLCRVNLPHEQQGVLCRGQYLILCNPWPIFHGHLTVAHLEHRPQRIEDSFVSLLTVAKDLSPVFSLFYNGPACGASAPDHLHFQAAPMGSMPMEKDMVKRENRQKIQDRGDVSQYTAKSTERSAIMLVGPSLMGLQDAFSRLLTAMKRSLPAAEEPMINIVCSYQADRWTVIIFPRRQFRPSVYCLEGEARILVSPGAVEMGGFIVTPRKKDFEKLDLEIIAAIFKEVSLDAETFAKLQASLESG